MNTVKFVVLVVSAGGLGFGAFYLSGYATFELTRKSYVAWSIGIPTGLLVFGVLLRLQIARTLISNLVDFLAGVPAVEDDAFYEKADAELQSGLIDKAAWARALVTAKG